jgi:YHS domain-containing protein
MHMRKLLPIIVLLLFATTACTSQKKKTPPDAPRVMAGVQTLENSDIRVMPVEPPPTINPQAALPRQKVDAKNPNAQQLTESELMRKMVDLPFAPAIAMDPVSGMKVSIRTDTPFTDYKNHRYYFSSQDNKREFLANADAYSKGVMARY